MTREEFLQGLKEALDGNMDASAIQENLNYYNEYINEEVRKGKTGTAGSRYSGRFMGDCTDFAGGR